MINTFVLDFKNIVLELESKELKIWFLKDRGIFIEDTQGNLYQMEIYRHGSYLDRLIKEGITVEFNLVNVELSKNIEDWEKEIWGVSEVKAFMQRQSL